MHHYFHLGGFTKSRKIKILLLSSRLEIGVLLADGWWRHFIILSLNLIQTFRIAWLTCCASSLRSLDNDIPSLICFFFLYDATVVIFYVINTSNSTYESKRVSRLNWNGSLSAVRESDIIKISNLNEQSKFSFSSSKLM